MRRFIPSVVIVLMLLRRLRADVADGADAGTLRIVLCLCSRRRERHVEPKVSRRHRRRLGAPDRERGAASTCAGARERWLRPEEHQDNHNRGNEPPHGNSFLFARATMLSATRKAFA